MKPSRYILLLAVALLLTSALVCLVAYDIYGKADEIGFWLLMETAFLPIQVLLVGLIIERLLARHERRQRLHKMNMVIGVFFTELGTHLLGDLAASLDNRAAVVEALGIRGDWSPANYHRALERARALEYRVNLDALDLPVLKQVLAAQARPAGPVAGEPEPAGTRAVHGPSVGGVSPDGGTPGPSVACGPSEVRPRPSGRRRPARLGASGRRMAPLLPPPATVLSLHPQHHRPHPAAAGDA